VVEGQAFGLGRDKLYGALGRIIVRIPGFHFDDVGAGREAAVVVANLTVGEIIDGGRVRVVHYHQLGGVVVEGGRKLVAHAGVGSIDARKRLQRVEAQLHRHHFAAVDGVDYHALLGVGEAGGGVGEQGVVAVVEVTAWPGDYFSLA
nr:hypothetical protein [Tanacetum cinerariifolium]